MEKVDHVAAMIARKLDGTHDDELDVDVEAKANGGLVRIMLYSGEEGRVEERFMIQVVGR